jgi:hypothetical protein
MRSPISSGVSATGNSPIPFSHRWNIAQHLREVPDEEIIATAARMFAGC